MARSYYCFPIPWNDVISETKKRLGYLVTPGCVGMTMGGFELYNKLTKDQLAELGYVYAAGVLKPPLGVRYDA